VNITSGSLVFFGNTYTVNRGTVSFYKSNSIEPMLDVDLATSSQGVNVNLTVSGPIDNLQLGYRSDPPLKFEDVIALLATGKTPPDPNVAVNQPYSPNLSATQMGESAVLGQAIADPLTSRMQRVFGVTQLKVAPTFENGSSLPEARITLQQQVSSAITFTYSQDLNQANSELISVAVELSPRFSAVATRDENGIFGVDFYYRKQFH
jgi:translocation and assembly module TamB